MLAWVTPQGICARQRFHSLSTAFASRRLIVEEPFWYEGLKLEVVVDGQHFELGTASGDGHNCLIDTLRKLLNRRCGFFIPEGSVVDVRNRLEGKHSDLASAITPGDYLELRPYWEERLDLDCRAPIRRFI